ncbi:serine/arginine-rich splicing factor SR45-like [Lagopus leucura]|uniref:serine/arginine-rich splicing factor SR45-like n=1 Tax=Lagopus leucura TaxID=30410 RepID=UPI001C67B3D0|nr:serine/arginine-rich splicing factor SR45-like [Lagopus leucura]
MVLGVPEFHGEALRKVQAGYQLELKLDAVSPTTQYFQSRSKRDTGSQVRAPRTPVSQILSRQEPRGRLGSPVCGRSGPVPPPETPPGSGGEAAPRVTRPTTHPRRIITRGGSAAASTAPAPACLCLPPLGGSPQPGVCRVKARIRFPASSIKISGKKSPAGERDGEREERGVSRRSVGKRSRGADNTRSTSSTRRTPGTPAARPLQLREKRFLPPEVSPRGRRGLPGAAGGSCLPNPLLRARCEALHPITPHPGVLPRTASSPLISSPPPPPPYPLRE